MSMKRWRRCFWCGNRMQTRSAGVVAVNHPERSRQYRLWVCGKCVMTKPAETLWTRLQSIHAEEGIEIGSP